MLNIEVAQSVNNVNVCGLLKSLEIVESKTRDGRDYVRATAYVKVDQTIGEKLTESEIPVKMFAMRKKSDGSLNAVYDRIVGYKESFISADAADDPTQASWVSINCRLEENTYWDDKTKSFREGWQVSGSFMNPKKASEDEGTFFELQGVVGKFREEFDQEKNETGRIIVPLVLIQWAGRADKIELIAEGSKRTFIESNWNEGDTVMVTGNILHSFKTITWMEEQGFGDPIPRHRTIGVKNLIIKGGSPSGLDEEQSFDVDNVKLALVERNKRLEAMKAPKPKATPVVNSALDF